MVGDPRSVGVVTAAVFDDDIWAATLRRDEPAASPAAPSSWRPVDLSAVLDGGHIDPPPVLLTRDDGHGLLYAARMHTVAGESESLKSWLIQAAAAEVLTAGQRVLYLDFEDSAAAVVARMIALGASRRQIVDGFRYVRPADPVTPDTVAQLAGEQATLVVLDGVTEAMSLLGLDPNGNSDVAKFLTILARPLSLAGATVVLIDHVTKTRQDGPRRYAIGAQHKLAAVDGAAYIVELAQPFGHGKHGIARVNIAKDRPGRVREHCSGNLAAELHLRSDPDSGAITATLITPASSSDAPFRPTVLMERVSRYLETHPEGVSSRNIDDAVTGKASAVRLARDLLVTEGYAVKQPAPARGRTDLYLHVKPYRNTDPEDTP